MKSVLLAVALGGCVTTAGLVKKDRTTLPILIGAAAADLVVGSIVLAQSSLSTAGSIASAVALTGVDIGIGCITGACSALRP